MKLRSIFLKAKCVNCYLHEDNEKCLTFGIYLPIKNEIHQSYTEKMLKLNKELNAKYGVPKGLLESYLETFNEFMSWQKYDNFSPDIWFTCAFN